MMERLSPEDLIMVWPDKNWPQEIGALAILDGTGLTGQDGRLRIEAVRAAVAARVTTRAGCQRCLLHCGPVARHSASQAASRRRASR